MIFNVEGLHPPSHGFSSTIGLLSQIWENTIDKNFLDVLSVSGQIFPPDSFFSYIKENLQMLSTC